MSDDRTVRPARAAPPACLVCKASLVWLTVQTSPVTKVAMWFHVRTPADHHQAAPGWPPGTFTEETPGD